MKPSTLRAILTRIFHALTHVEVVDAHYVPRSGPFLLVTNHMSRVDVPLLLVASPREDLVALVADKYRSNPLFAFMIRVNGSIWLDRDKADFGAFRQAFDYLRRGFALGIAPEGTRSTVGALLPAKTGVALLADKAQVPIVPVAISGTELTFRELARLRRPRLRVRFGAPIQLPPIDRSSRDVGLQRNTDAIMLRIAAMLPERYWGAYADHPDLPAVLHEIK